MLAELSCKRVFSTGFQLHFKVDSARRRCWVLAVGERERAAQQSIINSRPVTDRLTVLCVHFNSSINSLLLLVFCFRGGGEVASSDRQTHPVHCSIRKKRESLTFEKKIIYFIKYPLATTQKSFPVFFIIISSSHSLLAIRLLHNFPSRLREHGSMPSWGDGGEKNKLQSKKSYNFKFQVVVRSGAEQNLNHFDRCCRSQLSAHQRLPQNFRKVFSFHSWISSVVQLSRAWRSFVCDIVKHKKILSTKEMKNFFMLYFSQLNIYTSGQQVDARRQSELSSLCPAEWS